MCECHNLYNIRIVYPYLHCKLLIKLSFISFLCCLYNRFGKVEGVKILPQKYPNIGVAAFIDFYDIKSAIEAKEAKHKMKGCELRTNFKAKPTEKFEGRSRPHDGLLIDDKQESTRESARY